MDLDIPPNDATVHVNEGIAVTSIPPASTSPTSTPPVANPPSTTPTTTATSVPIQLAPLLARSARYGVTEQLNLFRIMQDILPIGPDEWDKVLELHSVIYPGRSVESLRRKYHSLHRKKIPTGDPLMPAEVRLAKRVKYLIGNRASMGNGEEEYSLEADGIGDGLIDGLNPDILDTVEGEGNICSSSASARSTSASSITGPPLPLAQPTRTACSHADSNSASPARSPSPVRNRPRSKKDQGSFLEMFQVQMEAEAVERKAQRDEREEERRDRAIQHLEMTQMLSAAVSGIASAFSPKRKKRKRSNKESGAEQVELSSDSSSSSSN